MTDTDRAVRDFLLDKARTLAEHPSDEISAAERDYLRGLVASLAADPELLPVLESARGRVLVYELQEHLHFDYPEREADSLYERFVGDEPDDVRELLVAVDPPPDER